MRPPSGDARSALSIEQLLALARYEAANAPPSQAIAFDRVACAVIADLQPLARSRAIDLGFERLESACVRTDPAALAIVIRNLVEDARCAVCRFAAPPAAHGFPAAVRHGRDSRPVPSRR